MGKPRIFDTADEAVADVHEGASVMFGYFSGTVGSPTELVQALIRLGVGGLTVIANGTTQARVPGNAQPMVNANQVKKAICSFPVSSRTTAGGASPFEQGFEDGTIELELVPQGTLAERMRAAGAGIPAFYTPTGVGTRIAEGKEVREFEGRQYVLERALHAEFALVKAYKADTMGNLVYRYTARNFNPLMASAARITIAEVDEIVEAGELDPEVIVTPGIFVDRLYVRKGGASA
jgi:3-oxoadipate CoA-transferase alpha subunit